jgi:hypothetical protein
VTYVEIGLTHVYEGRLSENRQRNTLRAERGDCGLEISALRLERTESAPLLRPETMERGELEALRPRPTLRNPHSPLTEGKDR